VWPRLTSAGGGTAHPSTQSPRGDRSSVTDIQRNKQTVVEFYELAFNAKQPEQAVEKYFGPQYIQHNPLARDGADAFIGFATGFAGQVPELSIEIKRVVGEGDIVATPRVDQDLDRGSRHSSH
jgi:predicted SnoaL-like aldol condensation-catalyzing enzyme